MRSKITETRCHGQGATVPEDSRYAFSVGFQSPRDPLRGSYATPPWGAIGPVGLTQARISDKIKI